MIPWFLPVVVAVAGALAIFLWFGWYLLTHPSPRSKRTFGRVMGGAAGTILGIIVACFLNFFVLVATLYQLEIIYIQLAAGISCYWWPFLFTGCWELYIARDAWYMIWAVSDVSSFIIATVSARSVRQMIRWVWA